MAESGHPGENIDHRDVEVMIQNIKRSVEGHPPKPVRILQRSRKLDTDNSTSHDDSNQHQPQPQPQHQPQQSHQNSKKKNRHHGHCNTTRAERKSTKPSRKMSNYNLVKDRIFRDEKASTRTLKGPLKTNKTHTYTHTATTHAPPPPRLPPRPRPRVHNVVAGKPKTIKRAPVYSHMSTAGSLPLHGSKTRQQTHTRMEVASPPPVALVPPAPLPHNESVNIPSASKDFDVCWEFNTAKGCRRGASCKWKHQPLLKDAVHPWTGDKLYGEFCAHRYSESRSSTQQPPMKSTPSTSSSQSPQIPVPHMHEDEQASSAIHMHQFRARHHFEPPAPFSECEFVTQTAAVFRTPSVRSRRLPPSSHTQLPLPPMAMPGVYMLSHDVCKAPVMTPVALSYCARCGYKCSGDDNFCGQCGLKIK